MCCLYFRSTYEYERKLRVDHSESLQAMKGNYDSMVTELEKLRAEMRNAANLDKSGMVFVVYQLFPVLLKELFNCVHLSMKQYLYRYFLQSHYWSKG